MKVSVMSIEGREKNTYRLAILLDSIKFPNNFVLKKYNNLFKSNKITNFNKKIHFKSQCLCIVRIVWFIDTIRFIWYAFMYRTILEHFRYVLTIRNFLYTIRYVSYDTDNYGLVTCVFWKKKIIKKKNAIWVSHCMILEMWPSVRYELVAVSYLDRLGREKDEEREKSERRLHLLTYEMFWWNVIKVSNLMHWEWFIFFGKYWLLQIT